MRAHPRRKLNSNLGVTSSFSVHTTSSLFVRESACLCECECVFRIKKRRERERERERKRARERL